MHRETQAGEIQASLGHAPAPLLATGLTFQAGCSQLNTYTRHVHYRISSKTIGFNSNLNYTFSRYTPSAIKDLS